MFKWEFLFFPDIFFSLATFRQTGQPVSRLCAVTQSEANTDKRMMITMMSGMMMVMMSGIMMVMMLLLSGATQREANNEERMMITMI